jgi:homoserine O-succinyltransferase
MSEHQSKTTSAAHLEAFYRPFSEARERKFDGLVITGAPIEHLEYESVSYWPEMREVLDWTQTNVHHTMGVCWGGMAMLHHFHGVPKHALPGKAFGCFRHRAGDPASPFLQGFSDSFMVPVSRWTEIRTEDVGLHGDLRILIDSDEVGPCLIEDARHRALHMLNHLEYDSTTLKEEYDRDVAAGGPIQMPIDYFPGDDPALPPRTAGAATRRFSTGTGSTRSTRRRPMTSRGSGPDRRRALLALAGALTAAACAPRGGNVRPAAPQDTDAGETLDVEGVPPAFPAPRRGAAGRAGPRRQRQRARLGDGRPPGMAARHDVIAFDRPGHGLSGWPGPKARASPSRPGGCARASRGSASGAPSVVGHSYGGSVALAWALDAPESVAGLMLIGAPSQVWPGGLGARTDLLANGFTGPLVARTGRFLPRRVAEAAVARVFAPQEPPPDYLERPPARPGARAHDAARQRAPARRPQGADPRHGPALSKPRHAGRADPRDRRRDRPAASPLAAAVAPDPACAADAARGRRPHAPPRRPRGDPRRTRSSRRRLSLLRTAARARILRESGARA